MSVGDPISRPPPREQKAHARRAYLKNKRLPDGRVVQVEVKPAGVAASGPGLPRRAPIRRARPDLLLQAQAPSSNHAFDQW